MIPRTVDQSRNGRSGASHSISNYLSRFLALAIGIYYVVLISLPRQAESFSSTRGSSSNTGRQIPSSCRPEDRTRRVLGSNSQNCPRERTWILLQQSDLDGSLEHPTQDTSTPSSWEVWKVIARLEGDALSNHQYLHPASTRLIRRVVGILKDLATRHDEKAEWQGILNKSSLLHEVEESILALHFLDEQLAHFKGDNGRDVVVVDACCGKGVFSLLCFYFYGFGNHTPKTPSVVKIIMLDKDPKLRWDHVPAANEDFLPHRNDFPMRSHPRIESWSNFNLHEIDSVVDRLSKELTQITAKKDNSAEPPVMAVVGIHLCKTLSPTCIGIVNALGPKRCPCLILAPCCLPRKVVQSRYNNGMNPSMLDVRQYESTEQRALRDERKQRRTAAMVRGRKSRTMGEQQAGILSSEGGACWKCGQFGHQKADCPSDQTTGKPKLIPPPILQLDVSRILLQEEPFGAYCQLLATSIQRDRVVVNETNLKSAHGGKSKKKQTNNWNQNRKSVYIVAGSPYS